MIRVRQRVRLQHSFFHTRQAGRGRWIESIRCCSSHYNFSHSGGGSRRNLTTKQESSKQISFPWRHNQHVLPRVELELLHQKNNGWRSKLALMAWEKGTMVIMSRSFQEIISSSSWRQNLADEFAWTFTFGLAELLSSTYNVPVGDILIGDSDDIEINFEYTTPFSKSESTAQSETNSAKDEDIIFEKEYHLMHKKFYQQSHNKGHDGADTNPLEIKLSMKPITSDLVRLYSFPFLSRDAVKEDPSLRSEFTKIIPSQNPAQSFPDTYRKMFAFADRLIAERGLMQTTVIAEVLVVCMETFHVKDLNTGELLQGHSTEQTVPHVLRMEMDVILDVVKDEDEWFQTNWRIADVDDTVGERDWWSPRI